LKYKEVSLTVYSADKEILPYFSKHRRLSGNLYSNIFRIYRDIKENDIDIVIGHTITSYPYLIILKFLTRAKIVLEMHGFIEEEAYLSGEITRFRYLRNKKLYPFIYKCFDLITTSSETATTILSKYNKNVVTIFGGVDLNLFNPFVVSKGYIKKDHNDIIIGYAGNARSWQGLDFLLEAYSQIKTEDVRFKLAVLTSESQNLKHLSGIQFFNEIDYIQVPHFLSDCDILVIPRPDITVNKISFPSKLVEYMAMGKAVVSSRTSDAHYVITNNLDGLLYQPGNLEEFKSRIISLGDVQKRILLGENAYQKVRKLFTWERQTEILFLSLKTLFSTSKNNQS
jgi:glycosyltransferase involved in cell wall biosynthesis